MIEMVHLLMGAFWSSVYTHISGFAVKGLLRCGFQGADVEHRMAIAISTKHTKQTSVCWFCVNTKYQSSYFQTLKHFFKTSSGGKMCTQDITYWTTKKRSISLVKLDYKCYFVQRSHLLENSAVKCSKASPSFSLFSGTEGRWRNTSK